MQKANKILNMENTLASRAKAAAVGARIDEDHSVAVAVKMRAVAQQWDELAADCETSPSKCFT
jgi:hypothetical protein